jgi:hypothetical protein
LVSADGVRFIFKVAVSFDWFHGPGVDFMNQIRPYFTLFTNNI